MEQVTRTLIDDVDGTRTNVQTVDFSFMGQPYEIDLGTANRKRMEKDFKKWIDAARKVKKPRPTGPGIRTIGRKSGLTTEQNNMIREFLRSEGHSVSPRGRISEEMMGIYREAESEGRAPALSSV